MHYLLFYDVVDDYARRREPFRDAHRLGIADSLGEALSPPNGFELARLPGRAIPGDFDPLPQVVHRHPRLDERVSHDGNELASPFGRHVAVEQFTKCVADVVEHVAILG